MTLPAENLLVGTTELYTVTTEDVGFVYRFMFSNKTQKSGFQKAKAGQTVSANKAYLRLKTASAKEFIGFDEMTTGINTTFDAQRSTSNAYNLNGQRVDSSYKGVIIQNGKKYRKK